MKHETDERHDTGGEGRMGSGGMNMNLDWIKDEAVRDKVALDVLIHGNGYVVENKDGSCQVSIPPERMLVILDEKTHKPTEYRTLILGHEVAYEPKHVWHGRLFVGDEI